MSKFDIPSYYDFANAYNAQFSPSTVHVKNTQLTNFFIRYLYMRLLSVYEFEYPDNWYRPYLNYNLFMRGHFAVFNTKEFGTIAQGGTRSGIGLYYQPTEYIVANPLLVNYQKLTIGSDCAIVRLNDDWFGLFDLISYYAEKMALVVEAFDMNVVNSKSSVVFFAKNKTLAESFKKMYDTLSNNPMVVVDKDMQAAEDEMPAWQTFQQDLKQNYLGEELLSNLYTIENQFNTRIGIPNIKYEKNERLTANEVTANNIETQSHAVLWMENIRKGFDEANEMFGLNLGVKMRFEYDRADLESEADDAAAL